MKREHSLPVFPASSRVVEEEEEVARWARKGSFMYNIRCTHSYIVYMSLDIALNFNVWKEHLLKCRFSFIMSGVGSEIPDLEEAFRGPDASSRIQVLNYHPVSAIESWIPKLTCQIWLAFYLP